MLKWVKYVCIIMKANITDRYVVTFMGESYVCAGWVVKKVRSKDTK